MWTFSGVVGAFFGRFEAGCLVCGRGLEGAVIAAGQAPGGGGEMVMGAVGIGGAGKGKGAGGLELKPSNSSWMFGFIEKDGLASDGVDIDAETVTSVVAGEIIVTRGELEVLGAG